jgi:hypothetical protein
MPSSYSPDLRIELIANGEQSGTWGTTTNTNLGTLIEDAIAGLASVAVTSADQALTALNGAADQARCAAVSLSIGAWGSPANFNIYVPPVTKLYVINNATAYIATVYCSSVLGNTTAAGTGIAIPAGKTVLVRADSAFNILEQLNHITGSLSIGGNASVTGDASVTGTTTLLDDLILNSSSGTSGQVVVSQGAGNPPVWGNAFVAGMIMMWSGTIATIPSGWALCNGSGGTPDLRDRFIVGASVDSGGQSVTTITGGNTKTGGSKDAITVSHTHTASTATAGSHQHSFTITDMSSLVSGTFPSTAPGPQRSVNTNLAGDHTHVVTVDSAGSSGTNANLVPYFALAYIMKT